MGLEVIGRQVRQQDKPALLKSSLQPTRDEFPLSQADLAIIERLHEVVDVFGQQLLVLLELFCAYTGPLLLNITLGITQPDGRFISREETVFLGLFAVGVGIAD